MPAPRRPLPCLLLAVSSLLVACGGGGEDELGEVAASPWNQGSPSAGAPSAGAPSSGAPSSGAPSASAAGAAGESAAAGAKGASSGAGGAAGGGPAQPGGPGSSQSDCVKACEQLAACDGGDAEGCAPWCAHHYQLDAACAGALDAMFSCFASKVSCLADLAACADEAKAMQDCDSGCGLVDVLHPSPGGCSSERSCGGKALTASCHADAGAITCTCLVDGLQVGSCQADGLETGCDLDVGCCAAALYGP